MNTHPFIRYDKITGQVSTSGFTNVKEKDIARDPSEEVLYGVTCDGAKEYVDVRTKNIIPRPESRINTARRSVRPKALGEAAGSGQIASIPDIPAGSTVIVPIRNNRYRHVEVNDGKLDLTFEDKGSVRIKIYSFPEQDTEMDIDIT